MSRTILRVILVIAFIVALHTDGKSQTTMVEKDFWGTWTPSSQSSCAALSRIEVQKDSIVLHNKNDTATFRNLDICYSCAGGAQYSGIEVYVFPEKDLAPSPFIIRFNPEERKGLMVIEMQDASLNKRFPFGEVTFKRCKK